MTGNYFRPRREIQGMHVSVFVLTLSYIHPTEFTFAVSGVVFSNVIVQHYSGIYIYRTYGEYRFLFVIFCMYMYLWWFDSLFSLISVDLW